LRVTDKGVKTFYFRYTRGGNTAWVKIGCYPTVTLQKAYETHADLTKRLLSGEDVRNTPIPTARNHGAALAEPALTVGDLAREFIERYIRRERKRPREAEQVIENNIVRFWATRAANSITRRDGVLLLDKIVDRGRPVMANRVGALLSQMFRFAEERGMLEASPFVAMGRPGGTERARKRRLDEREIRTFWKKLARSGLNSQVRVALKLILATAQRPGEVALAA
jgi:integrase